MPVFKGAMKVAKRNMGIIIMYIVIVASVLSLTLQHGSSGEAYAAESVRIAVSDQDNSLLSKGLTDYLSKTHEIIDAGSNRAALQESLYYRDSELVIQIPAGFGEDSQTHPLQITEIPGSYTGFYVEGQIGSFLRLVHLYQVAGDPEEVALEKAAAAADTPSITMTEATQETSLQGFFQFIPYGALCILCFAIGNVLHSFLTVEVRKRTNASAFRRRKASGELILAIGVFGALIFCIFLIMGAAINGNAFFSAPNIVSYLLNMAAMILVCIAIAYLVSMIAHTQESLTGIVNSISLGMCFLCGVFVPLELLGSGVKTVAQFLPFYWYEQANNLLSAFPQLTSAHMEEFLIDLGIQLIFAAAILAVGATLHKKRR